MGTRGTYGVRVDDTDKLSYNHFDSYPECLGREVIRDIKDILDQYGVDWFTKAARDLVQVDPQDTPTQQELDKLNLPDDIHNPNVSTGDDWYSYTRDLQGELKKTLEVGVTTEGNGFIYDSLFCEFGYIANLDNQTLEFYVGFQKEPPKQSRYIEKKEDEYYPCELLLTIPFSKIQRDPDHAFDELKQTAETYFDD